MTDFPIGQDRKTVVVEIPIGDLVSTALRVMATQLREMATQLDCRADDIDDQH